MPHPKHIQLKIERKPELLAKFGISRSTLTKRIKAKLLPPPIPLGARAVGFIAHETDAVLSAMIAGYPNEKIIELVNSLIEQRKNIAGVTA